MVEPSRVTRPQRYSLLLNPYTDTRLSRCPNCEKPTHPRKFALLISIDQWGPMALGKTCRYCSRCELIIVHQDELEAQLAQSFSQLAPAMIGNAFQILGTIPKKIWQQGLGGKGQSLQAVLEHITEFKHHYELDYQPGGWYPDERRS